MMPVDLAERTEPSWPGPKPRLTFFRVLGEPELPTFVRGHFRDQERCLAQFFDVTVVTESADYDEIVDRTEPDLVLFESGVYARAGRAITNTHTHPEVPKLGFLHSDGYCLSRSVFLADMDDWGVDTYFAYAMSAVGYTPDIADRTYLWPNFADRSVFRSYPDGKSETILLSGSREANYPWRVRVHRLLAERFPSRSIAHGGWFDRQAAAAMPVGSDYARSLSSALIVPTCGTIAEEFVRKYVEIPAAGAVLLAERTAIAESAGFVDMENCVFADESDVVDKVEHLLDHPEVLERIAAAGQELAHSRHSIEHRDQIRQWFELNRKAAPGQRIVQPDPFAPMELSEHAAPARTVSLALPPGLDRSLLAEAREQLSADRPMQAAEGFAEVLNLHYEPEAALGLARSWLRSGRPAWARGLLEHATDTGVAAHGASHPDPVEWAWLIRASLCEGDLRTAGERAARYSGIRHPELDRMRSVVAGLGGATDELALADRSRHRSVHGDDGTDWSSWVDGLALDLRASGRSAMAEGVARMGDIADPAEIRERRPSPGRGQRAALLNRAASIARRGVRRVQRELDRRSRPQLPPDRTSLFQLLGGIGIDTAVLVLVDQETGDRFEPYALRCADPVGVVRIGRATPVGASIASGTIGLRTGAEAIRYAAAWGRSVIVASPMGASFVDVEHLSQAAVFAVIGGEEAAVEVELRGSAGWIRGDEDLHRGFARALGHEDTRLWVRAARAEASDV
ncbi:glycosyltransferase [Microbacterium oryzae]|uniref:glycosyltransferase family protein n=1 Tax=Microbacterium oryzae TaxID=743009 RepID=UPI0025AF4F28|nr:glycosyltransferase [Microbacterium oryzae]MDN3310109.1 glycosyltransferase [Microbacterium oryzae]